MDTRSITVHFVFVLKICHQYDKGRILQVCKACNLMPMSCLSNFGPSSLFIHANCHFH